MDRSTDSSNPYVENPAVLHMAEHPVENPAVLHMEHPVETPASPPNNNGGMFSRFAWSKQEVQGKLVQGWRELPNMIRNSMISLVVSTIFTLWFSLLCWLFYFHPHTLHPEVDSAALVAMELGGGGGGGGDGGHALVYDLALNVTFTNKFSICRIHFEHLTAGLYYGGAKIGATDDTVPSFKLGKEASRTVLYSLRGRASNVSDAVAETYTRERAQGLFNVNVAIRTMLTYRFFPHKISYYFHYDCWLQFPPVPGDGTPALTGAFECGRVKSYY